MLLRHSQNLPVTFVGQQLLKSSMSLLGFNLPRLSTKLTFNPLYLPSSSISFAAPSRVFNLISYVYPQFSLGLGLGKQVRSSLSSALTDVIYQLKRTFQPSLIRRKRKHGFLARKNSRHGLKIIHRRLEKGRRALCA